MAIWILIFGIALGIGVGSCSTWLFMMNKHAGRPVQWQVMVLSAALTIALIGAFVGHR